MDDKEYERIKKKLQKYLKRWSFFVDHWGWKYTVNFCDGVEEMPVGVSEETAGYTVMRWQYLDASVYFNIRRITMFDDDEIEHLVIHELSHFLIAPFQSDKKNLEISVSMIARTLKGIGDTW